MHKRARHWYLIVSCLVAVSFVLASCGGSGGSSVGQSPKASSSASGGQAASKEPFKVGATAAMTGPAAPSYLPNVEGFRVFVEALNAKGGIDGHPLQVQFEDDHADPGTATTNIQKFVGQGVSLLLNFTSSGTYAPTTAEAKRANLPIIMMGAAPDLVLPPKPEPLVFAITNAASNSVEGPRVLFSASQLAPTVPNGTPIKFAFVTVDIPTAVSITNNAIKVSKEFNAEVTMIKVPQGLADFTPIASQIISEGYNWATAIGPAVGASTYTALDKLGYKGTFLDLTAFDIADLAKLQKDNLYLSSPVGPLDPNRPELKPILDAAKTYGATVQHSNIVAGWAQGESVAEILKQTGYPASTDKMLKVMNNLKVAHNKAFPPTEWTETNHHGPFYWRFYKYDKTKQVVAPVMDIYRIDPTGDPKSITKVGPELPQ